MEKEITSLSLSLERGGGGIIGRRQGNGPKNMEKGSIGIKKVVIRKKGERKMEINPKNWKHMKIDLKKSFEICGMKEVIIFSMVTTMKNHCNFLISVTQSPVCLSYFTS